MSTYRPLRIVAVVNTRFSGMHYYPGAPERVSFLRYPHRHEFHVSVAVEQLHEERDVEYLSLKYDLDAFLSSQPYNDEKNTRSCETMAREILEYVKTLCGDGRRVISVVVTEDGENGASVSYNPL